MPLETLYDYIRAYGSAKDPDHIGDGGEAIYAADRACPWCNPRPRPKR